MKEEPEMLDVRKNADKHEIRKPADLVTIS
jgi:hypothetical protein